MFTRQFSQILITTMLCTQLAACANITTSDAFIKAQQLKKNHQYQEAEKAFNALYAENEYSHEVATQLASIERKLGKPHNALALMGEMHKQYPENQEVLIELGYAMIESQQYKEAINLFDGLIEIDPKNITAYSGKAVAFDKAGNHLAAQDIYLKGMAIDPTSLTLTNNLAMSLILNGEPKEAIKLLEPIHEQQNSNSTIRQNLALAYGVIGDKEKALNLNLKDLSPEQAHENIRFYEKHLRHYKAKNKHKKSSGIGFENTSPAIIKKTDPKPQKLKTASKPKPSPEASKKIPPTTKTSTQETQNKPVAKIMDKTPVPTQRLTPKTPHATPQQVTSDIKASIKEELEKALADENATTKKKPVTDAPKPAPKKAKPSKRKRKKSPAKKATPTEKSGPIKEPETPTKTDDNELVINTGTGLGTTQLRTRSDP